MGFRCANDKENTPNLDDYADSRAKLYKELKNVRGDIVALETRLKPARRLEEKLLNAFDRERRGAREARRLRKLAREDRLEMQQQEFLPTVYRVRITLELDSLPAGTTSVVGVAHTGKPRTKEDDIEPVRELPYLRLSYITDNASWTPHYDLRLDTIQQSGSLTYRSNFTNRTGETWKDAKVTLSTSQNTFSGIQDTVPWMAVWTVGLSSETYGTPDGGFYSSLERSTRRGSVKKKENAPGQMIARPLQRGGGMDSIKAKRVAVRSSINLSSYATKSESYKEEGDDDEDEDEDGDGGAPGFAPSGSNSRLRVATSTAESHGTTTVYELPGSRTITSSPLVRRHVIAELPLRTVEFSHISIPKLRGAVFLKARITNKSHVSFLKGSAGLTLDGSFMGNTSIPLCVPGGHFDVGLGVDESIQVFYSKPAKKTSSQGLMMMKENVVKYTRNIRVHNSRVGKVKLIVIDQVPVSDDERLRIAIVQPKGLRGEGDAVSILTGSGERLGTASLKKNGEMWYELTMQNGGDAVLPLEYEARMPQGVVIKAK